MKKILTACFFLSFLYFQTQAQNKVATYILGSFGLSSAKSNTTTNSARFSTGLGLEFYLPLSKRINIVGRPGINWRGYDNNGSSVRVTYLDVPLTIEYAPLPYFTGAYIGVGVYGGTALGGKFKLSDGSESNFSFGETTNDNRSRTDYGLAFTAGMRYANIEVGIQNQVGLKNVVPNDRQTNGASIKLRNFTGFIGLNLAAFKKKKR